MDMNMISHPPSSGQSHRLAYRPDIQGLRAVAILLVVAAHAKLQGFTGGFVGVDVFFVLSGYLITALLVEEMRSTGRVQFARFYIRRLRRLLPALFVMLASVGLLAWLLVPTLDQFRQVSSAVNAAGWISNIYFALVHLGYFSPSAATNLFLHTWSLGVEEQFYLLWPMLIVASLTGWSQDGGALSVRLLLRMLIAVGVFSLGLCLYWSYHSPRLAFYMMPARGWQFSLGAIVYMLFGVSRDTRSPTDPSSLQLPTVYGWLGLTAILCSAMLLDNKMTYPGFWALAPSFGAAALIAAGVNRPHTRLARCLSVRPMRWIGQVSYSWYLWHWPILLFGTYMLGYRSLVDRLLLAVLSLVLAAASHALVERPIRHARWTLKWPRMSFAAAVLVVVSTMLAGRAWDHWATANLRTPAQLRLNLATQDLPVIYMRDCDSSYRSAAVRPCVYGNADARHTAVIIGDSVGLQWFPAIHKIFKQRHWRLIVLTKSSCPMVDEPFYYSRIRRNYARCAAWRKHAFAKLADYKPDIVIIGSTYWYAFTRDQWIEGTRKLFSIASRAADKVYLLRSTPRLPFNGPYCLSPHSHLFRWLTRYRSCTSPAHNRLFDEVFAWRRKAIASFPNVSAVDMTSAVCPAGTCHAQYDGHVVFRDEVHITASFARSLAPQLASMMQLGPPAKVSIAHTISVQVPH